MICLQKDVEDKQIDSFVYKNNLFNCLMALGFSHLLHILQYHKSSAKSNTFYSLSNIFFVSLFNCY